MSEIGIRTTPRDTIEAINILEETMLISATRCDFNRVFEKYNLLELYKCHPEAIPEELRIGIITRINHLSKMTVKILNKNCGCMNK